MGSRYREKMRKCSTGPEKWFELRRYSSNRGSSYRESTVFLNSVHMQWQIVDFYSIRFNLEKCSIVFAIELNISFKTLTI